MNYQEDYENKIQEKERIEEEIKILLNEYARQNCPYKIGEKIKILGYSHQGKIGLVEKIRGTDIYSKPGWEVLGVVLKKDGTEGLHHFRFNEGDE